MSGGACTSRLDVWIFGELHVNDGVRLPRIEDELCNQRRRIEEHRDFNRSGKMDFVQHGRQRAFWVEQLGSGEADTGIGRRSDVGSQETADPKVIQRARWQSGASSSILLRGVNDGRIHRRRFLRAP